MTINQSTRFCRVTCIVAATGLLTILLGCDRKLAPEIKPETKSSTVLDNKQIGVTISSPTQPGWKLVKSDDRETRFEWGSTVDTAIASSRTLPVATFGKTDDLLARLETWKESQLADKGLKQDSLHFYRAKFKGLPCLQYDGIYENVSESKSQFTHFNFKGYLCPIRDTEQSVVEIEISNRTNQRGFSEEMIRNAEEFFESANFTPAK